jgi:hypothetical protein
MGEVKIESKISKVYAPDVTPDDLKRNVLVLVAEGKYDEAIDSLNTFLSIKSDYPNFKKKTERFVNHSIDLINAIRAKKNFPGFTMLTRSKQQEIGDKIADHYNELQFALSRVGVILQQIKREDVRSTLWLLRALVYAGWLLMIIALAAEIAGGLYKVGALVIDDYVNMFLTWLFGFF